MLYLFLFCKIHKISLAYGLKFTVHMCCYFAVCPVPMNKEEEEFIKERERNRELMEEIAREIEMTCLGKLKKKEKKLTMIITIVKTLDEQSLPANCMPFPIV